MPKGRQGSNFSGRGRHIAIATGKHFGAHHQHVLSCDADDALKLIVTSSLVP